MLNSGHAEDNIICRLNNHHHHDKKSVIVRSAGSCGIQISKSVPLQDFYFFFPSKQSSCASCSKKPFLSLASWFVLGMDETGSNNHRSSSMIRWGYSELQDQNGLQTAMDPLLKGYHSLFPSTAIKTIFTYPFFLSTIISPSHKAKLLHHSFPSPASNFSLLVEIFLLALLMFVKKSQFISTCLIIHLFLISEKKIKENKYFGLLQSSSFICITRPFLNVICFTFKNSTVLNHFKFPSTLLDIAKLSPAFITYIITIKKCSLLKDVPTT